MAWTGIGSRETPLLICEIMRLFATTMRTRGRSGGAKRADEYFEKGMRKPEIYLPWRGFSDTGVGVYEYTNGQWKFALDIVDSVYPVVVEKQSHQKLFGRNVFQVLGLCDCEEDADPSKFVLCWTPDGCIDRASYQWGVTGGTGVAIMVADLFGVPVYNMQRNEHMLMVLDHLEDHGIKTQKFKKKLKALSLLN